MKFAKMVQAWDGGYDLHELVAFYFPNRVESELFVNKQAQAGCKWVHNHTQFADIIDNNEWRLVNEADSSEKIANMLMGALRA